jgi:hypothetical protein
MFGCGLLQLGFNIFPVFLFFFQIFVVFFSLLFDLLQLEGLEQRSFFLFPQLLLHLGHMLLSLLDVQFCLLKLLLQFLPNLGESCFRFFQQSRLLLPAVQLLLLAVQLPLQFLHDLLPADGLLRAQLHFLRKQLELVFLLLVGEVELRDVFLQVVGLLQQGLPLLGEVVDVGLQLRVGGGFVVEGLLQLGQFGSVVVSVLHEFHLRHFVLRKSCLLLAHCHAQSRLLLVDRCQLSLRPLPLFLSFSPLVYKLGPFIL